MVFSVVSTFPAVNVLGLKTILLLKSLFATSDNCLVVPTSLLTSTVFVTSSPWVDAVETVTTFLVASQVTTFVLTVVKLLLAHASSNSSEVQKSCGCSCSNNTSKRSCAAKSNFDGSNTNQVIRNFSNIDRSVLTKSGSLLSRIAAAT